MADLKEFELNDVVYNLKDETARNSISTLQSAVGSPLVANTASAMSDTTKIYVYTGSETGYTNGNWYYYNGSIWVSGGVYNSTAIGAGTVNGSKLSSDIKQALLSIFEHVAYTDNNGQNYYDTLENALYPPTNLSSINAVYTQSGTVYDTDSLDDLKTDLIVTANYEDGTSETVANYTLSGTLEEGTSTITVAYGGKATTFDVTVSVKLYTYVTYVESDGQSYIDTGIAPRNTMTELTFALSNTTNNTDTSVCGKFDTNQRYYVGNTNGSNNFTFVNRTNSQITGIGAIDTSVHTQVFNDATHQAIHDGEVKRTNSDFACTDGSTPLILFGRATTNLCMAKIYSAKFTDNDTSTLLGDFRPCYRNSDGVIGFHDLVSDVFFTNQGTGTFTKGADIIE